MAKKEKFYVVWQGHKVGVFSTWEECRAATFNYPKAKYKSFPTLEQAQKAFQRAYTDYIGQSPSSSSTTKFQKIGQPNYHSIAVDAASSGNPGTVEYRGVYTKSKKEIFHQGPFEHGTNNIGEFLALVHGLALLKKHNSNRIIYTDSKIAMNWVRRKKCNTKLQRSNRNAEIFELVDRAEKWLQENDFSTVIVKWETKAWGEIPADFGRK